MSRSGYYAWLIRPPSQHAMDDARLLKLIKESYEASGRIYGSPRILCDLRGVGERCGKNRVAKLMNRHKIHAQRGYKKPGHKYYKPAIAAPNRLEQQFTANKPDKVWVTDITYIRTYQGWLFSCRYGFVFTKNNWLVDEIYSG